MEASVKCFSMGLDGDYRDREENLIIVHLDSREWATMLLELIWKEFGQVEVDLWKWHPLSALVLH